MCFSIELLNKIYDKTGGRCHVCHRRLSFGNYAKQGKRAAWEVDHSRARANGGSNHLNNLLAACIPCNRRKSDFHTRTARKWNEKSRAPFSYAKLKKLKKENTITGGVIGGFIGGLGGPLGVVVGTAIGSFVGNEIDPQLKRKR